MGGVGEGGVVRAALPSWKQRKEPGVFAVVCKGGKKQVGLLCFCSLPLWHSWDIKRKPWPEGLVAAGCGGQGVPGAASFHPSFVPSLAQPCSERCWGKAAAPGAGREGEERGKGEEVRRWRRRRRRQGQRKSRLPFRGTWSPGHVQGVKQGEWSNQFSDKAIYYQKAAGFSVCPVSPGRWECGQGDGKNWMQLRLHGLWKCLSTGVQESWL